MCEIIPAMDKQIKCLPLKWYCFDIKFYCKQIFQKYKNTWSFNCLALL